MTSISSVNSQSVNHTENTENTENTEQTTEEIEEPSTIAESLDITQEQLMELLAAASAMGGLSMFSLLQAAEDLGIELTPPQAMGILNNFGPNAGSSGSDNNSLSGMSNFSASSGINSTNEPTNM
jgi:hypothetical protein